MNIVYYLDWFPRLSQSFILNELYYLHEAGHNVSVFSINRPESNIEHDETSEIDVSIGYADNPSISDIPPILSNLTRNRAAAAIQRDTARQMAGTLYLTSRFRQFVRTLPYEVNHVHSHFLRWNKLPAAHVARDLGVSATITGHAYDIFEESDASLVETIYDAFDAICTISKYNISFLRNEFRLDDRLKLVRMGVRPEKFEPTDSSEDAQLLTVARHTEKKGLEYAIEAIDQIVDAHPSLEYRIVGEGPRTNRLRRLIEFRGLQEYVTFLGTVDDDQLVRELDSCTAFVLPCIVAKNGDRDGIPVALMEAMAMETPVISTYVSGIPELVTDGATGFLVPSGQPGDLAETMDRVLTEEDYRDRVGNAARETIVERFSSGVTGERLETLFREISGKT